MPDTENNVSITKQTKVGIFMPCYNMGHFLGESLESISKQTFKDYRVVIADDASPSQESRDALAQIKQAQCEVYFEKKNLGLVKISNKYLRSLNAQYILLLSPDDKLHPDFLKEHVAYLDSHPDVHAVCSWVQEFGDGNQLIRYSDDMCKLPYMLVYNHFSGAALIRRSEWIAAGMHDTNKDIYPNIDWGVWLAMLEKGYRLATIPKALFYWRVDRKSISHGVSAEQTLRFRKAIYKRHISLYKVHFEYVLNYYLERLSDFEKYYVISEEGHEWLDGQYHSLTRENETLRKALDKSIQRPYLRSFYRRMRKRLKRVKT